MSVKTKMMWMMRWVMRLPSCEEVDQFAYDYLEGHLDYKTVRLVDRHLKRCKNCQRFLNSYRKIRELGANPTGIHLDPEFTKELSVFLRKKG